MQIAGEPEFVTEVIPVGMSQGENSGRSYRSRILKEQIPSK